MRDAADRLIVYALTFAIVFGMGYPLARILWKALTQ